MVYRIEFRPAPFRQFSALPRRVRESIRLTIDALANNPRPTGVKKLKGMEELYRIKAGPGKKYRVIYQIRDEIRLIVVVKVGHRRQVYRRQ